MQTDPSSSAQKIWHTELSFASNTNGMGTFRGFYGTYEVETVANGKKIVRTFDLSSKAGANELVVQL